MSVYICLVLVYLLAPAADSVICVPPDQFESTVQHYNQNVYNVYSSVSRRMVAFTTFVLNNNNKPKVLQRTVKDYNVMVQFVIPVNGPCTMSKINKDIIRELPDDAVKVDHFPLPHDLPEGIEYWKFKWVNNNDLIVGVMRSPPNICDEVVWGPFNSRHELLLKEVSYIRGNYSTSIRDMSVFDVPLKCLPRNSKST